VTSPAPRLRARKPRRSHLCGAFASVYVLSTRMTIRSFFGACLLVVAACGSPSTRARSDVRPGHPADDHPHHDEHAHHHAQAPAADAGPSGAANLDGADAGATAGPADAPPDLVAAERVAYERAKPVFDRYCVGCHTKPKGLRSTLEHLDMTSYPFGGHHAEDVAAMVRTSVGATGKRATMPKNAPGTLKGEDLALVLAWADAFDRAKPSKPRPAAPRPSHGGHKH
jgi:hypothetical protein